MTIYNFLSKFVNEFVVVRGIKFGKFDYKIIYDGNIYGFLESKSKYLKKTIFNSYMRIENNCPKLVICVLLDGDENENV